MTLNELKSILLGPASDAMKNEGLSAFNKGLVTGLKGRKIDNIYHIYGRVADKNKSNELITHIKINLKKKTLESAECSCDDFKEFASGGYTLMCSHITATAYKFLNHVSEGKNEAGKNQGKAAVKVGTAKLIRKTDKSSLYYQAQKISGPDWLILKPEELRAFLESIESRKIRFKFDYIEFTVPVLHKDLPVTFNLKEDGEHIILTTQKQLPVPLNPRGDVYYFRNELYLPSENQIEKFAPLYEKLKAHGKIVYRKDISGYNRLLSLLSSISQNINIAESLKNYVSGLLKPQFFMYEENSKIYCDLLLNYGSRKINILEEKKSADALIRDYIKEEKLLMEMEKNNFLKLGNRFLFTGGDEELFNILSRRESSLHFLGNVIYGKGLKDRRIYNSDSIHADLYDADGYFDFSYSIGDMGREELKCAYEAYRDGNRFYRTKGSDFLDFEDKGVRSFFNIFDVLNLDENIQYGKIKLEKNKALYVSGFIRGSEEMEKLENRLSDINSRDIALPHGFNGTLRDYQVRGFKWLKNLSELGFGGILADEMGLGKTIQTIAFLLSEKNKKTLIVCPTSLIYNWKEELDKFAPDLKVLIVHGSERAEAMDSAEEYDVVLTTYGTLRIDIGRYNNIVFDCCIIDEGQNIKNADAQSTKVIKEIKARTRFALTGTPIENNLTELWSLFDFIMPGYLYSKEKFEEKFILRANNNLEGLKQLIKPFILRRTKKEVIKELPDKIEKKFLVEMTAAQKAVYKSFIESIRAAMKNSAGGRIEIFSYLTRLRQICLDPSLIIEDYAGGSGKLEVAVELIKDHIASGGKVLLFSQFTSALNKIGERLDKEDIEFFHLDGKTNSRDRIRMVNEFNNSVSTNVFLISLKAGGTGLNLTSANLVIHFDPWWNPAVEDQASDRAHRIGQSGIVEVIKLVAKGTIEEKIILLQEDKKALINDILADGLQNSNLLSTLSKEDLLQLFERD